MNAKEPLSTDDPASVETHEDDDEIEVRPLSELPLFS
jgi:hypothetical protein